MIKIIFGYTGLIFMTWVLFLAIMALKTAKDSGVILSPLVKTTAYIVLILGILADFTLNMCSTIIFMDLPKEWLLTYRCRRYITSATGYRKKLATWLCKNMLDPFQQGGHCHAGE